MSYDPRNRFRSYDEMIIALDAAIKAQEHKGINHTSATQAHVILRMQLRAKKKRTIIIMIVSVALTLLVIILALKIINSNGSNRPATVTEAGYKDVDGADINKEIINHYRTAKYLMSEGKLRESEEAFIKIFFNSKVEEPTRSWAGLDGVTAALLDGRISDANRNAIAVADHIAARASKLPPSFATVLAPTLRSLHQSRFQDVKKINLDNSDNEYLMAVMISGLKNWNKVELNKQFHFSTRS
jgi:hypothetical protein